MSMLCSVLGVACQLTFSGPATVQDGDTIYVNHQAIRLEGVDAEELSEPNGYGAKLALRKIIGGSDVSCVSGGAHSYQRTVARCFVGLVELNQSIIAAGWALDCKRYSGGRYRKDEPPDARGRLIQKPYC